MIDYIKVVVKDQQLAGYLRANLKTLFDSYQTRIIENGDGNTYKTIFTTYKGLSFKITESGAIIIEGSLHKYKNGGEHNFDDFSYCSLVETIRDLCSRFKINPAEANVHNVELGVNIIIPFDPTEVTDRCILLFNSRGLIKPSPITKNDAQGFERGVRFELTEYCLKVYNKGKQYNQIQNILRVEYKTKKARIIGGIGIVNLLDLCNIEKLRDLTELHLYPTFDQLLLDEFVDESAMNKLEQKHFHQRLNFSGYWKKASRTQRKRNKDLLQDIYSKYSMSDIKALVRNLMKQKVDQLLQLTTEALLVYEELKNQNVYVFTL